ncbi:MAG: hypothetical protein COT91_04395 [Candidatus Doudnabacteria bacterium CG10_big_fil_rev_8_21_14_0_10_41_10]|uniref:Exonuclease domain-containing protein n=1 Tax=Candidatus Doudnabacteria bacterium CG10_big_fil_rev_8_21_14_0_10_41_10 TaxID=1974551 RepID=A0A2H0VCT0_9BACT|nr:MAG: hypothetical protein COT91_04395 [Candidatus Doudnabacteria bacterium CG10_big_fil_rev_8_21_14_0_10_41_10]
MKFCALDLEGTGLDPKKDSITEAGAVLFEITKTGQFRFLEEFTQLVKPKIPIPQFIQDLTNISEADVKNAPEWEEVMPRFKKFVGDYVIVGQNISFDLAFLASHGLDFKQDSIDTKEVAQVFCPKAEFYNLEYLMRFFNILLENHHRALDDSKSAAILLYEIMKSFQNLPASLRKDATKLLKSSDLVYRDLFILMNSLGTRDKKLVVGKVTEPISKPIENLKQGALFDEENLVSKEALDFSEIYDKKGTFFVDVPFDLQGLESVENFLRGKKSLKNILLSLPNFEFEQVKKDAKKNGYAVFDRIENYFCEYQFNKLLNLKKPSNSLTQFLLKILVWKDTADKKNILSLPLSGEEFVFRKLITGHIEICESHKLKKGETCELAKILKSYKSSEKVLTSHEAWQEYVKIESHKFNFALFWDVYNLEKEINIKATNVLSLKQVRSIVGLFYDPQNSTGVLSGAEKRIKGMFSEIFNDIDLSFGILEMSLQAAQIVSNQRVIDQDFRESEVFLKPQQAFTKLAKKIDLLVEAVKHLENENPDLKLFTTELLYVSHFLTEVFVSPSANVLHWLDAYRGQVKLKYRNKKFSSSYLGQADTLAITGSFSSKTVQDYYSDFLEVINAEVIKLKTKKTILQVFLPEGFPSPKNPNVQKATLDFLQKLIPKFKGRTLVLFSAQKNLEHTFETLPKKDWKKRVVAQRISGHQWKNLEFYSKQKDPVWFLTVHNFLRNQFVLPRTDRLIVLRIPYDVPGIFEVLYDKDTVFSDFIMPKTVVRIGQIVSRFINSGETRVGEKQIIFLDQRITQDYNSSLLSPLSTYFNSDFFNFSEKDLDKLFK